MTVLPIDDSRYPHLTLACLDPDTCGANKGRTLLSFTLPRLRHSRVRVRDNVCVRIRTGVRLFGGWGGFKVVVTVDLSVPAGPAGCFLGVRRGENGNFSKIKCVKIMGAVVGVRFMCVSHTHIR